MRAGRCHVRCSLGLRKQTQGKRERFKRTMAAIEGKIAQNPDLLSNGGLNLPAFVDRNPQARARVMAQLAQVAADAYRGAPRCGIA